MKEELCLILQALYEITGVNSYLKKRNDISKGKKVPYCDYTYHKGLLRLKLMNGCLFNFRVYRNNGEILPFAYNKLDIKTILQ